VLRKIVKRRYPRVNANLVADVTCSGGIKLKLDVLDTSSTGLKLQCNWAERDMLTPRGQWTQNGRPIEADIRMDVPVSGNKCYEIKARCLMAFSRRVARDRFHVGMQYLDLDEKNFSNLSKFISTRLKEAS